MNKLHSKLKIIFPFILSITASLAGWHLAVHIFQKGLTAYKNNDYAAAIAWEPIAQKGYGGAAYKLGKIYQLCSAGRQRAGKFVLPLGLTQRRRCPKEPRESPLYVFEESKKGEGTWRV